MEPPLPRMRRDSAQKKPAFTAGGSREAEMATPTRDPGSKVQQDKTLLYIYIYIYTCLYLYQRFHPEH